MSTVLVGSARIDENGKASGGTAGDQTGNEVSTQSWYSKPWDFMAIHPDADVREKHASLVEAACSNNKVGYDQGQRNTLHTQAKALSYAIAKITTACECDCSSLQHVCAIGSGGMKESTYGSNGMTTSTMKTKLKNAGYVIITESAYLKSAEYCVRGAIYVKSGSHTVCGLTNGSKYSETLAKAGISTALLSTEEIAKEVIAGKWGNGAARKSALTKAGYDYATVQAKVNELTKSSSGSSSSGSSTKASSGGYTIDAAKSQESGHSKGTSKKTTAKVNFRTGAGTTKTVIKTLAKGSKVTWYGYYTKVGAVKWYLVVDSTGQKGYICGTYLS